MKYIEALSLKEKKEKLIGTITEKGFIIGDILILPENSSERDKCLKRYILNLNSSKLEFCFQNQDDVVLWAIDIEHLKKSNILFYKVLE